jgi:hypothetical protein
MTENQAAMATMIVAGIAGEMWHSGSVARWKVE